MDAAELTAAAAQLGASGASPRRALLSGADKAARSSALSRGFTVRGGLRTLVDAMEVKRGLLKGGEGGVLDGEWVLDVFAAVHFAVATCCVRRVRARLLGVLGESGRVAGVACAVVDAVVAGGKERAWAVDWEDAADDGLRRLDEDRLVKERALLSALVLLERMLVAGNAAYARGVLRGPVPSRLVAWLGAARRFAPGGRGEARVCEGWDSYYFVARVYLTMWGKSVRNAELHKEFQEREGWFVVFAEFAVAHPEALQVIVQGDIIAAAVLAAYCSDGFFGVLAGEAEAIAARDALGARLAAVRRTADDGGDGEGDGGGGGGGASMLRILHEALTTEWCVHRLADFRRQVLMFVREFDDADATEAEEVAVSVCARCGRRGEVRDGDAERYMACSQCRLMQYCSPACQRADWGEHRQFCSAEWPRGLPNLPGECEEKVLGADVDGAECTHVDSHSWFSLGWGIGFVVVVAGIITRYLGAHYVLALVVCYVVYCNLLPED